MFECKWNFSMELSPRDGTHILVAHKNGWVIITWWTKIGSFWGWKVGNRFVEWDYFYAWSKVPEPPKIPDISPLV